MASSSTESRKMDAIKAANAEINEHTLPALLATNGAEQWEAEQVAQRIEAIAPVIRSAKWQQAVANYAGLIRAEGTDPRSLVWAIGQGSVWFAYAAF